MQIQPNTWDIRIRTTLAVLLSIMLFFLQNGLCAEPNSDSISLESEKRPLEEVLKEIGQASGYTFVIGDAWKSTPISVNFRQLALDDALKRILANMNYAVIYDSPTTIRIVIYGMASTDRSSGGISGRYTRPEPDVRDIQQEVRMPEPEIAPNTPDDNLSNEKEEEQEEEQEEENSAGSPSQATQKPTETTQEQAGQPQ